MVAIEAAGTDRASDPAARRADALGARTRECGASNRDARLPSTSTAVGAAGSAVGLTAGVASVARGIRCGGGEAAPGDQFAGEFCCDHGVTGYWHSRQQGDRSDSRCPEAAGSDAGRGVTIVGDKSIGSSTGCRACDAPGACARRCAGENDTDRAGKAGTDGTGERKLEGAGDSSARDARATAAAGRAAIFAVCRCAWNDPVFARSQAGDRQQSNRRSR